MKSHFNCPVEVTAFVLGGKWKSRILWELRNGKCRFGQIGRLIPEITKKVLMESLLDLENHGLIKRTEYKEKVLRVEYELTEYGRETLQLVKQMSEWGSNHANNYFSVRESVQK